MCIRDSTKEQRQKLIDFGISCGDKDFEEDLNIIKKAKKFFESE